MIAVSLEKAAQSSRFSTSFLMNSIQFSPNFIYTAIVTIKIVSRRFPETFQEAWPSVFTVHMEEVTFLLVVAGKF